MSDININLDSYIRVNDKYVVTYMVYLVELEFISTLLLYTVLARVLPEMEYRSIDYRVNELFVGLVHALSMYLCCISDLNKNF